MGSIQLELPETQKLKRINSWHQEINILIYTSSAAKVIKGQKSLFKQMMCLATRQLTCNSHLVRLEKPVLLAILVSFSEL